MGAACGCMRGPPGAHPTDDAPLPIPHQLEQELSQKQTQNSQQQQQQQQKEVEQVRLQEEQERQRKLEEEQKRINAEEEQKLKEDKERHRVQQLLEEEQMRIQEAQKRVQEEERRRQEEEKKLKDEQERQRAEAEQQKIREEQERQRQEEQRRLQEEQERQRLEAEKRLLEEQERQRQEEQRRLKEEQERQFLEEQKRIQEEQERQRQHEERQLKELEERQRLEAEQQRIREEQERQKQEEQRLRHEEERQRVEAEQKRIQEEQERQQKLQQLQLLEAEAKRVRDDGLMALPDDVLRLIMTKLNAKDMVKLGQTSKRLECVSREDDLWKLQLQKGFGAPDLMNQPTSSRQMFTQLMQAVPFCSLCHNTLQVTDSDTAQLLRCLCIFTRHKYPLTVLSFTSQRNREISFESRDKFSVAQDLLKEKFHLSIESVDALNSDELDKADIAWLDTTACTIALSPDEAASLADFIDAGGSGIFNAFSNWTRSDYGQALVRFLGIDTVPLSSFGEAQTYQFAESDQEPPMSVMREPFGVVREFCNNGQTLFTTNEVARDRKVKVYPVGSEQSSLALFPRIATPQQSQGNVIVCTNMHWCVDPQTWHGGLLQDSRDNQNLLLNFAAAALYKHRLYNTTNNS